MPSPESREHLRTLRQNPPFGAAGNAFDLDRLRACMGIRYEPGIAGVQCLKTDLGGLSAEWVMAPGADPDLRLLYLHGGGYISGAGENYLPLAAEISAAAGCAVLLPDYRLAPEHPFPAGLEDCLTAYCWLRAHSPAGKSPARATFIAGDSAGGGLTLATLLALRDRDLPLPVCGLPLSAYADLTMGSDSIVSEAANDPIMSPLCLPVFTQLYLGETNPRDPLASPVFADYTGLPPLLIQVGEYEVIRDDSSRVAEKARAAGVQVQLEVWPGMFHVFQIHGLPESREAVQHMADFMHRCLDQVSPSTKVTG